MGLFIPPPQVHTKCHFTNKTSTDRRNPKINVKRRSSMKRITKEVTTIKLYEEEENEAKRAAQH